MSNVWHQRPRLQQSVVRQLLPMWTLPLPRPLHGLRRRVRGWGTHHSVHNLVNILNVIYFSVNFRIILKNGNLLTVILCDMQRNLNLAMI